MNYLNKGKHNQKGQVVIILLLLTLVGLAIGLAITQRSVTDLQTSSKSDQSTRAFSAAEAGIEKAISTGATGTFNVNENDLGNQSRATVKVSDNLPSVAGQAIEFPPIGKADLAQFWLVNPNTLAAPSPAISGVWVYWGNSNIPDVNNEDMPALEITEVAKNNSSNSYVSTKYFVDANSIRRSSNGADKEDVPAGCTAVYTINTILSTNGSVADKSFKCRYTINFPVALGTPYVLRVRLLYSNAKHPIAVKPITGSLPPQVSLYTSQGNSGETTKVIQVVRQQNVVSPLFDYALFSKTDINKN